MYRIEITVNANGREILDILTVFLETILKLLRLSYLEVNGVILVNPELGEEIV